jgi:hypothetical protein
MDKQIYAVLTGDIIASTAMAPQKFAATLATIRRVVETFGRSHPGAVTTAPDIFRGDSWQLVLAAPALALRLALLIRMTLRSEIDADTRISIGIGGITTLDVQRASLSVGEAFMLSGTGLDGMTLYYDLSGGLASGGRIPTEWLRVMLRLVSTVMRGWTRRQAEIVLAALLAEDATHEALSRTLSPPVSKQTVSKTLNSANWHVISDAIAVFEKTEWQG